MAFLEKIISNIKNKFKRKPHPIQCNNINITSDLNNEDFTESNTNLKTAELKDKLPTEVPVEILEKSQIGKEINNENNILGVFTVTVGEPKFVVENVTTIYDNDIVITKFRGQSLQRDHDNTKENESNTVNCPSVAILEHPENLDVNKVNKADVGINSRVNPPEREFSNVLQENNAEVRDITNDIIGLKEILLKVNMDGKETISYDSLDDIKLDSFDDSDTQINDLLEICNANSKCNPTEVNENSPINDINNNVTNTANESLDTVCFSNIDIIEHFDSNKDPKTTDFEELIEKFNLENKLVKHTKTDQSADVSEKENKCNTSENFEIVNNATDSYDVISLSSDEFNDLRVPRDDIETISISSADTINEYGHLVGLVIDTSAPGLKNDPILPHAVATDGINSSEFTTTQLDVCSTPNVDDDDGYNSSDFEFITEEEAFKDGLIINYKPKLVRERGTCKTIEITNESMQTLHSNAGPSNGSVFSRQTESIQTSNLNAGPSSSRETYRQPVHPNYKYRQNHAIPAGDDYYNLFQGIHPPLPLFMLENKSIINSSSMNIEYQGIGFNLTVLRKLKECDSESEELKEEARQNALKIAQKYPRDNRKRRRRL